MTKFSVLMSLYKNESPNNLMASLESLNRQTLRPTEIILVLDGPIGESLKKVIELWIDVLNIISVQIDKNVGLGRALNYGLGFCNYDLVARMDTDDICLTTRFEKQIQEFIYDDSLALIGTAIQEFDGDINNIVGTRAVPESPSEILNFAKYKNPFNHMTVIFKKSVVQKVGGYKHHHFMEDYNLWLRIISNGYKTKNLQEVLLLARTGNAMILRRKGLTYIKSEYQLARLKYSLGIQNIFQAAYVGIIRSLPRIMPAKILFYIYKYSRK
ncbi:glycosyltransferase [Dryocola clanedunensis]